MEIKIKGKNAGVSKDLVRYAEDKARKLVKFNKRMTSVSITFTERASKKHNKSHCVEVVLHVPGHTLRSKEAKESFFIAFDATMDKLKRQLKKIKTKRVDKSRERPTITRAATVEKIAAESSTADLTPVIVVERFAIKPISTHEAIKQLDMTGLAFLPFVNEKSVVSCIYRRDDGGYGLLVPDGATE